MPFSHQAKPNDPQTPVRAVEILGKLGLELAFVEPGKDTGLLPINSFVMIDEAKGIVSKTPAGK